MLQKFNKIHPNIKFTMAHTTPQTENTKKPPCMCIPSASIPYLDTKCEIRGGQIIKDLYRKPTDKKQYLLTSSWHPIEWLDSIPFSFAMRITRICSEDEDREFRRKCYWVGTIIVELLMQPLLKPGPSPGHRHWDECLGTQTSFCGLVRSKAAISNKNYHKTLEVYGVTRWLYWLSLSRATTYFLQKTEKYQRINNQGKGSTWKNTENC